MQADNKFFNVIVDHTAKTFHIKETSKKMSEGGSTVQNLKNIHSIINEDFKYKAQDQDDKFAQKSNAELYKLFQEKSQDMTKGYKDKYTKLYWFQKLFIKDETQELKKYFNLYLDWNPIFIKGSVFKRLDIEFTDTVKKPGPEGTALNTLKHIENYLNKIDNQITIFNTPEKKHVEPECKYVNHGFFSKMSRDEQLEILKEKTIEIKNGYDKKIANLNIFSRWYFSEKINKQKRQINDLANHIKIRADNLISPPKIFFDCADKTVSNQNVGLDDNLVQVLAGWLEVPLLDKIAMLNKHGKNHKDEALIQRAIKYGYTGAKVEKDKSVFTTEGAKQYLNKLFKELDEAAQKLSIHIPGKLFPNNRKRMNDYEGALDKLSSLRTNEFFQLFANEEIYSNKYTKLRTLLSTKFFSPTLDENISLVSKMLGAKALTFATKNNEFEFAKLLLAHKADPNLNVDLSPPLAFAAQKGREDFVQLLLENKADVNKIFHETTALSYACGWGNEKFFKQNKKVLNLLLEAKADPNIGSLDRLPLHLACGNKRFEDYILPLIQAGANINLKNTKQQTPLHIAFDVWDVRLVNTLLENGADPLIAQHNGVPLIHTAIINHMYANIIPLIQAKTFVDTTNAEDKTPLYCICELICNNKEKHKPSISLVKELLVKGANVNAEFNGVRLLELARVSDNLDLISLLMENGATLPEPV